MAHRDDRDLVEQDDRHRQADLAERVRRRQDGGREEGHDDGIFTFVGEPVRRHHAGAGEQGENQRQFEADAEGEDQLHDQGEIFVDLGLELDRQDAVAAHGLEAQEKLPGDGHEHVVDQRATEEKQDRREDEKRQERLFFVLIEAGCDEFPHLVGHEGEREEQRREEGHLDLGEEHLGHVREDHPSTFPLGKRIGQGGGEEIEDIAGEIEADEEHDQQRRHGADQARAQLDEMFEQRRLAVVDLGIAGHRLVVPRRWLAISAYRRRWAHRVRLRHWPRARRVSPARPRPWSGIRYPLVSRRSGRWCF